MLADFDELAQKIIAGVALSFDDVLALTDIDIDEVPLLAAAAGKVRQHFAGGRSDLCSIISARSGRCGEDCRFCAQSIRYDCDVVVHPMLESGLIAAAAKQAEENGAHRFCIVTSGDSLSEADFNVVLDALTAIKTETSLKRCASLGRLTGKQISELADAGLCRYHHNLETSRSFFPKICTTHSFEDRLETIGHLKSAGLETCVGGIFNLGESDRQRIELAFELKALEPDSVPLNFLNPRPGTPLEARPPMEALEAVKYIAIFKLVMPNSIIRLAAGRCETLGSYQRLGVGAGVNGLLIGDYLTTAGPTAVRDLEMLTGLGFDINPADA